MTLELVFDADLDLDEAEQDRLSTWAIEAWTVASASNAADSAMALGCVRFCSEATSKDFNTRYRDKDKPTNVLSFAGDASQPGFTFLGDLLICLPIVEREALAQGKAIGAHLQHLVVHGTLHLLGYDHEADDEALMMEAREIDLLKDLGVDNPY